jgi:branched-chain amino acid transport system permease protein
MKSNLTKVVSRLSRLKNGRNYAFQRKILTIGFLVVLLFLPTIVKSSFMLRMINLTILYCILSLGQQLITGYGGMLSMGHIAFFALGAYTSALLTLHFNVPFLLALVTAGIVASVFGFLLGLPSIRVGFDYLTMITIGFSEIIRIVAINWSQVTGGFIGLPGIPVPKIGPWVIETGPQYYYLFLSICVITYLVIRNLADSKAGRALMAIRENELAARSMGVNVSYYKVLAFTVGTFFAGLAGSLLAHWLTFVGPSQFTMSENLVVMQMVILGGLGSLPGAILGATILTSLPELLRVATDIRPMIGGILMVSMMIWRPEGLLGKKINTKGSKKYRIWPIRVREL